MKLTIRFNGDEYEIRNGAVLVASGVGRENGRHNLRVLRAAAMREQSRSTLEAAERAWATGSDAEYDQKRRESWQGNGR